jgi:16S rRNA (cytosine1402-N4)-methyltransferase
MNIFHTPVLLEEVIEYLKIKSGEKYIDATLGGGGHSQRIHEPGGVLLSLDQDVDAINFVIQKFKIQIGQKWQLIKGNFANIEEIAKKTNFNNVAGILFDLGVSSHQIEEDARGFSFDSDEELDMRMDQDLAVKASVLVNGLTKKELEKIFLEYGEEEMGWKIAAVIEKSRKKEPIVTCRQLAEICAQAKRESRLRRGYGEAKPATQVFQALRIVVNDELGSLEKGLIGSFNILKKEGRIVVISFHSLEDRIVKQKFRAWSEEGKGEIITQDIVRPSDREVEENPRARSAKMRVFEKK